MPRYWTLAEARAALPEAIALLEQLRGLLVKRREQQETAGAPGRPPPAAGMAPSTNGPGPADPERAFQQQVQRIMERIANVGFQIKDVEVGLIDFPHLRGEEEVLLCYRLGEPDILYWHALESGFAGRRPIDEL